MYQLKDYLKAINQSKEKLMDSDDELWEKKYNTYVDTLVFPRNQINHLNILKKYNFNFYRSVDQSWYKCVSQVNIFAGKIANLIDKTFPIKTNTISPKKNK